ncbi:MAG: RNA pseudouridine synthase [Planctomycetes bacterium]|nr:RNA pseudouridine synthase [Planctomycetota bacterium]
MTCGAVWLTRGKGTRRLRRARATGRAGDELHLYYDPAVLDEEPPPPELLADEGDYTVWFKPYGLRSQGSRWGDHCTVARWSEQHLSPERPAFAVHRLDRAANGLILLAHSKRAAAALSALFRERRVEKRYRVLAHGRFPHEAPTLLDAPLDDRPARSWVQRLDHDPRLDRSLLEVRLESGRKHQIRRHLALAGFAVVGDRLHGAGGDAEDLQLCACLLAFRCPLSGATRRYALPADRLPLLHA